MGAAEAGVVKGGAGAGRGVDLSPDADDTEGGLWGAMGRRERLGGLGSSEGGSLPSDFSLDSTASFAASAEVPRLGSIFTCCRGEGVSALRLELAAYSLSELLEL